MERLAALLEQLDLPEISRMLRHTVFVALAAGIVALGVLSLVGLPLAGLGACIGLGLGLVNIRLVMSTASRLNASGLAKIKRPMAMNTLMRLALTTVVAIVLVVVNLPLGMGVLGGVAVFYFLFVVNLIVTLLRQGSGHVTGGLLANVSQITVGGGPTFKLLGLTVNKYDVIAALVAGALVIGLGLAVRVNITAGVPGKMQLAFEAISDGISRQVDSSIGSKGRRVVPLAMTLFLFILFCNWLEMIPSGHDPQYLPAPTGDVNLTYAMALTVIVLVHATWIRTQGTRHYIGHYFRPYKGLFLINLIEEIAKPLTLALRLFGNIFSGGIMLLLIWALFPAFIVPFPDLVWKIFDGLFVAPVQAFIFSLLTILYFEAAMSGSH